MTGASVGTWADLASWAGHRVECRNLLGLPDAEGTVTSARLVTRYDEDGAALGLDVELSVDWDDGRTGVLTVSG